MFDLVLNTPMQTNACVNALMCGKKTSAAFNQLDAIKCGLE